MYDFNCDKHINRFLYKNMNLELELREFFVSRYRMQFCNDITIFTTSLPTSDDIIVAGRVTYSACTDGYA